jgi:nitrous oxidase accessory protein
VVNKIYRERKSLLIAVGIVILAIILLAGYLNATAITVDNSGSADYKRIQDAIDNASAGDTILVYSGEYYEDVNISKRLVLRGIDNGERYL